MHGVPILNCDWMYSMGVKRGPSDRGVNLGESVNKMLNVNLGASSRLYDTNEARPEPHCFCDRDSSHKKKEKLDQRNRTNNRSKNVPSRLPPPADHGHANHYG